MNLASKSMLKIIENKIKKAWKSTGKEFAGPHNPTCIYWKEKACLAYPFYFYLNKQLNKTALRQEIAIIPEYRPNAPGHALCGDRLCSCNDNRKRNEQIHIDLCLVKFKDARDLNSIVSAQTEGRYLNMWCFKPRPVVAIEFKYPFSFNIRVLDEDVKKLLIMEKLYGAQLLYMCFASAETDKSDERVDIAVLLKHIKKIVGQKTPAINKFRLAYGALNRNDWKIYQVK